MSETVVCPDCESDDIGSYKYTGQGEPDYACRDCGIKFDYGDAHFRPVEGEDA